MLSPQCDPPERRIARRALQHNPGPTEACEWQEGAGAHMSDAWFRRISSPLAIRHDRLAICSTKTAQMSRALSGRSMSGSPVFSAMSMARWARRDNAVLGGRPVQGIDQLHALFDQKSTRSEHTVH